MMYPSSYLISCNSGFCDGAAGFQQGGFTGPEESAALDQLAWSGLQ
jgi:hypothetical protein